MKYVILTRYAVRFPENNPRRRYETRKDWLDYRLKLFQKYTLPSVQAQTYKDFDWWLIIDPTFPGITEYKEQLSRFANILEIEETFTEKQVAVGEALKDRYRDEWVCSTRLDSDDIISNDFIEQVVNNAQLCESYILFPKGYMMKEDKVCPRTYHVNPFVSYVERADPFKSVFRTCHTKFTKYCARNNVPIVTISTPSWIQVDHGDNIKNNANLRIVGFDDKSFSSKHIRDKFTWVG